MKIILFFTTSRVHTLYTYTRTHLDWLLENKLEEQPHTVEDLVYGELLDGDEKNRRLI